MRFSDEFLDEIRARLPVSEVVRTRVPLKKQGREWRGLSPFNKEKTPSFFVNDQKGFYHDFSSGKSGDQFKFLMETEGLAFPEAVERLAAMAGVPMPLASKEDAREEQKRKSLYEVMELATQFFEQQFQSTRGRAAREYATGRGLSAKTIHEFRIGFAPNERFALKEFLGGKGIPVSDMLETGLLIGGDDIPVPYDRFRDRLIIPIHDQRGRVIAFGGRALSPDAQAKYLNSPETPLFHKGATIFNFHRARQPAHEDGSVVVVEGYMDAIAVYQAGLKSVVANMGTALTEEQISSLWRLSDEPIICFDADRAGVAAAHRAVDRILPALTVGRTFRFAIMHGGKDPDELIKERGLKAFQDVLSGSLPLWDVLWARETERPGDHFATPDSQAALEASFKKIIQTIKDEGVRSAYARTSRMQLASFFWEILKHRRDTASGRVFDRTDFSIPDNKLQKVLLGMLVHYPDFLDEKLSSIERIHFDGVLEKFRSALYNLLFVHGEVSVQIIYKNLGEEFYSVLKEVHGKQEGDRRWGHRLFQLFPILKQDPPRDFLSKCIDLFIEKIQLAHLEEDIDRVRNQLSEPDCSDELSDRLIRLIRTHQTESERLKSEDMALAEWATEIRRTTLGPEVYSPVAA